MSNTRRVGGIPAASPPPLSGSVYPAAEEREEGLSSGTSEMLARSGAGAGRRRGEVTNYTTNGTEITSL